MSKYILGLCVIWTLGCGDNKPPVLPVGTATCNTPYYGQDCMDNVNKFPTFKNGLSCNQCQLINDGDTGGCAWVGKTATSSYWCVMPGYCGECSALNGDFAKKK